MQVSIDDQQHIQEHTELDNLQFPAALAYFTNKFLNNNFGSICRIFDRLWFENDLKQIPPAAISILTTEFPQMSFENLKVCQTCYVSVSLNRIPTLCVSNGFTYPPRPAFLPDLDIVTERLISPRIPFMQIRRLRHGQGQYGILGQIINVPVSVNTMVNRLPRELDEDYCINVHIKREKITNRVISSDWLRNELSRPGFDFLFKLHFTNSTTFPLMTRSS